MSNKYSIVRTKSGKLFRLGQVVCVRNRNAVIREIQFTKNELTREQQHLLSVEYTDNWSFPRNDCLIWEREINKAITDSYNDANKHYNSFNNTSGIEEPKNNLIAGDEHITALNEQIYEAIEILFSHLFKVFTERDSLNDKSPFNSVNKRISEKLRRYCIKFVLNLVFVLFSEDKGIILPDSTVYYKSYSINGLYHYLEEAVQSSELKNLEKIKYSWPRLLALFRLLSSGSQFQQLSVNGHGEILAISDHPIDDNSDLYNLTFLKEPSSWPTDLIVFKILKLLRCLNYISHVNLETKELAGFKLSFAKLPPESIGLFYEGVFEKRFNQKRKVNGVFYTNPQLVAPTVKKALEKLVFHHKGTIKTPDQILDLKILDPAMGASAVFLFASLRFLTSILYESIQLHSLNFKLTGFLLTGWNPEQIKLFIMTNCLYGIDNDHLAVELARASMWIEVGNENIPFTFLDHKLKTGNAILGCWFEQLLTYPLAAWSRDCGDKNHQSAINFEQGYFTGLLRASKQRITVSSSRTNVIAQKQVIDSYHLFSSLVNDAKSKNKDFNTDKQIFQLQNTLKDSKAYTKLRIALDSWCSIWFWPIDHLDDVPLPIDYLNPRKCTLNTVNELKKKYQFFHWELEFPEIFTKNTKESNGFDAIIGNPPWETLKPHSKEFFEFYDPSYRSYGKQKALKRQKELFYENPSIEREWLQYQANMKAFVNFVRKTSSYTSTTLLKNGHSDRNPQNCGLPFRYQGQGNLNYYQLFAEMGISLLKPGGRLGLVVPSSIYSDLGAVELRKLFLEKNNWEWLFSFENRLGIFPGVHRSFKFCTIILTKGTQTNNMQAAFMRHELADWESSDQKTIRISCAIVNRLSPLYSIIPEIPSMTDADILTKIYDNTILLKKAKLNYVREFDMTNHSKFFPPLLEWIKRGYKANEYGSWEDNNGNKALPLYEGRMIGQFNFSKKGWVSGKGRTAKWQKIPLENKIIQPQYLMASEMFKKVRRNSARLKIAFIHVSSATNTRSMICSLNTDFPHGNSAPFCVVENSEEVLIPSLFYTAYFNSFCFDYALRLRLTGTNLTWFTLEECPVLDPFKIDKRVVEKIAELAARLNFISVVYSAEWLYLKERFSLESKNWQSCWAVVPYERTRIRAIIDALIAHLLDLTIDEFAWILRNDRSNAKGFWRVDQDKPEELRLTSVSIQAFQKLKEVGITRFCNVEWDYPDKIKRIYCLKNEKKHSSQDAEVSWVICENHTRVILGEEEAERLKSDITKGVDPFVEKIHNNNNSKN